MSQSAHIQYLSEATPNYARSAMLVVKHIRETKGNGNILLFIPTPVEVEQVCSKLGNEADNLDVLPLYSELWNSRNGNFLGKPSSIRMCIVAMNLADAEDIQGNIDLDQWCFDAFLSRHVLDEVNRKREELEGIAKGPLGGDLKACGYSDGTPIANIRKALARSFFYQSAIYMNPVDDIYKTVHGNQTTGLLPESCLVGMKDEWVIYDAFIHTTRQYIRNVTALDPDCLIDLPYFQDDQLLRKRGAGHHFTLVLCVNCLLLTVG
ncbi:Fc.00g059660.m01.CDS01 [Cosmosporella sp. VM-42]